jgi:hypothetical protein
VTRRRPPGRRLSSLFHLFPAAATNALDHDADIAKLQEWLGTPL